MTRGEIVLIFSMTVITTGGLLYQFNFRYQGHDNTGDKRISMDAATGVNGEIPGKTTGYGSGRGSGPDTGLSPEERGIEDTVISPGQETTFTIKEIRRKEERLFLLWEDDNRQAEFYRIFISSSKGETRMIDTGGFTEWELEDLVPGRLYIVYVASYDSSGLPLEKSRSTVVLP